MSAAQKRNQSLYPEWLQLLQPKLEEGGKAESDQNQLHHLVKNHVSEESRVLAAQIATVDAKVAGLNSKLDDILHALSIQAKGVDAGEGVA